MPSHRMTDLLDRKKSLDPIKRMLGLVLRLLEQVEPLDRRQHQRRARRLGEYGDRLERHANVVEAPRIRLEGDILWSVRRHVIVRVGRLEAGRVFMPPPVHHRRARAVRGGLVPAFHRGLSSWNIENSRIRFIEVAIKK